MASQGVTIFKCTLCGQVFCNKSDLSEHMLLHLGSKKHLCTLCGKKFYNEKSLDLHIRIHATEVKYEAISTSMEEQGMTPDQADNLVVKTQNTEIPQVKVRVKSFPANTKKDGHYGQLSHDNEMHFQLGEEEFRIMQESEVYTTQGEVFQEKKPVQLKVWSKEENFRQATQPASVDSINSSYVIRVMNKDEEDQRIEEPETVGASPMEEQSQQPIRIFVGNNIRLENLDEFNSFAQPISTGNFKQEELPQVGVDQGVYGYEPYRHGTYREDADPNQPLKREMEEDLQSLQEVIEEGDLHSFKEGIVDEDLKSLEEGIIQGALQVGAANMEHLPVAADSTASLLHQEEIINRGISIPQGTRTDLQELDSKDIQLLPEDTKKINIQSPFSELGQEHQESNEDNMTPAQESKAISESMMSQSQKVSNSRGDFEFVQPNDVSEWAQGKALPEKEKRSSEDVTSGTISVDDEKGVSNVEVKEEKSNMIVRPQSFDSLETKSEDMQLSDLKSLIKRSKERPHKCLICGLTFRFSFYLKAHMSVHTSNNQPYGCGICGKSFKNLETYEKHQQSHSKSKIFSCHECSKEFNYPNQLRKHMEMHEELECHICQEKYVSGSQLRVHIKSHTTYKCYICDKDFKESSKLKRHIKSHLNKQLHHCKMCNRTLYCQANDFQRHELIHINVISCPWCAKDFESRQLLIQHKQKCSRKGQKLIRIGESIDEEEPQSASGSSKIVAIATKEDDNRVRSRVAELLISNLLEDISETEDMGGGNPFLCDTQDWLEKVSDGMTKVKMQGCLSVCKTREDILGKLSSYLENDIIKDAVDDCLLRERTIVQKLSSIFASSEFATRSVPSVFGRGRKRKELG